MEPYVVIGGLVLIALVVIAIVRHAGGTSVVSASLASIEQRVLDRFASIERQLGLIHASVNAPVSVVTLPAPAAPSLPPAAPIVDTAPPPAPPAPPAAASITDILLGVGSQTSAPPAAAPPEAPVLDFTVPVMDFARYAGQSIPVAGTVSKKFTGCPTPVWVQTINGSGSTITANGASHEEPNGQAVNRMTVAPINGDVDVTVVCDTSGRTMLTVLAAPQ